MADERQRFCLIVGAGVSGLTQAAELLRKGVLKAEELEIIDRDTDYGGVWNAATYPGAACDVFSVLYQISWFRNPGWSSLFPGRDELSDYYRTFANKYNLHPLTSFNTNVEDARWSDDEMLWTVITKNTVSGQRTTWKTNVLVYAPGTYNRKVLPNVPGIESFKGESWHTYDWPRNADLSGKVVAYVGSGPSAVQILRSIQPTAKSLRVFVRSMTFNLPMGNPQNGPTIQFLKKWVPGLLNVYAFILGYLFAFWTYYLFRPGTWIARSAEWYCARHFEKEVQDPVLRGQLRPVGRIGAKRPLVSTDFYKVLQEPNVEVVTDPITRIDESGVISVPKLMRKESATLDQQSLGSSATDLGELKETLRTVDVLIWGTGFQMQGWGTAFKIIGRNGKTLGQHWDSKPQTLYGLATSDFPNLLILSGPNTVVPWASIISGIELQARYNVRVIRTVRQGCSSAGQGGSGVWRFAMMPKAEAEARYTASLQPELEKLATSTKFSPRYYYLSEDGTNTFFFPFSQMYYRWLVRRVDWDKYVTFKRHFA